MLHIERDPNRRALETEVANKLEEIYSTFEPEKVPEKDKNQLTFVSIEDAIRELLQMGIKE